MKLWIIGIAVSLVVLALSFGGCAVSSVNSEARLRNHIVAKQRDNQSEFDNLWKKIAQTSQVAERDRDSLKSIFVEHAQARTSGGAKDGSLMKWVTESVPTVDNSAMKSLMNTITGSRDAWTMRQKEILDLKRAHDNLLDTWPSKMFLAWFGRTDRIEVQIITSGRAEAAMTTGRDDSVDVFPVKK